MRMRRYGVREIADEECVTALALVLTSRESVAEADRSAERFLRHLAMQGLRLDWKLAITADDLMIGACVGINSPGRTMLILPSPASGASPADEMLTVILQQMELGARSCGVVLLQALVHPWARATAGVLQGAGYEYLAELQYLSLAVPTAESHRTSVSPLVFEPYSSANELLFERTLGRTHLESQDCRGLDGLRTLEDITLSHRHTGLHDPGLWALACDHSGPAGVLLLTRVPLQPALEVVYMGVVPEARGRGYGRQLVAYAVERTRMDGRDYLALAVDQANRFAVDVYRSFGFRETDRRRAWIRPLGSVRAGAAAAP